MADTTTRGGQHFIDHREEAVGYLKAAWAHGEASDGMDRAIPIQQAAAITHALLYVGDALRAIRESIDPGEGEPSIGEALNALAARGSR